MSKRTAIACYQLIIQRLRKQPASFKELNDYLERESDIQGEDLTLTLRTFQRYVAEIRSLYHIDIEFDFTRKVYSIVDDQMNELSGRMLEAFDIFNVLNVRDNLEQFIYFEKRKAKGSEHFYGMLYAIRNKLQLELVHQKFEHDEPTIRIVNPFGLKEFKGRWYLLATLDSNVLVKSFGLDRVLDFTVKKSKIAHDLKVPIKELYADCFGIINPLDVQPQKIILSFTAEQGKYIQTYPLHSSQKVLIDTHGEFRIELVLKITSDLISELLSFGEAMVVLSPAILKKQMKSILKETLDQH